MALIDLLTFPHFIILLVAVIFLTISIAMVVFHKPKKWFFLHKIFAALGIILSIIGVITLEGLVLGIIHGILGLIVLIVLVGELFGGYIAVKMKNRRLRLVHIWASRVVYFTSVLVLILGILNFI